MRSRDGILVLLMAFATIARNESRAQSSQDSLKAAAADSLVRVAETYLARGNMDAAEEAFNDLIKVGNDPRGYLGIGRVLLIREKWSEARHQFDKVIEFDPSSVEAHYYGGISYRETGRWRGITTYGISQEGAYARSFELFHWVLARDSTYRDVLYQHTLLLKNEGRYGEAMRALCAQIRFKPHPPVVYPVLVRLCRAAIREGRGAELWSQIGPPLSDLESYIRAETMRHEGRLAEAEKLLSQLVQRQANIPPQLAYLSLVRIYAARGQDQPLEETYWRAIAEIRNEAGAAVAYEDLKYILNPMEMAEFSRLPAEEKRDQFFSSTWNRRNPTLASPSNPRLIEHYKRLVYAERNYYLDRERFSPNVSFGFLGFNFEFKDIGLVYIRHGPPSEVLRKTGIHVGGIETWIYNATSENPEMMFHFDGSDKSFSLMGGLQSGAGAEMNPISPRPFPGRTTQDEMTPLRFGGDQPRTIPPELAFWDPKYFLLMQAKTEGERSAIVGRIAGESSRTLAVGLATERHTWAKDLKSVRLPNTVSAFRGTGRKTLLEIAYVIPGASLLREAGDSARSLSVESGVAIYDKRWRKLVGVAETLEVSRDDPQSLGYFRLHRTSVKPDTYYVAIFARPSGVELLGNSEQTVVAPDFSGPDVSMSDIQLALEIRKATDYSIFNKDGLRVLLNPLQKHSVGRPLYVYLEIYNPATLSGGGTQLELDLAIRPAKSAGGILSGILGLFGEKKGYYVSSEVERWRSDGALVKYLTMDVSRMEPGACILEIKVTDKLARRTLSRTVPVEFYRVQK